MAELHSILDSTQSFVTLIFTEQVTSQYTYHNLAHTESVVAAAIEVAEHSNLSEEEISLVTIAAWLHDIGYKEGHENHEEASIKIAEKFLTEQEMSIDKIEQIKKCIAATRMPQSPKNLMEEVLCDADLYHLSCDHFFSQVEKLRDY